MIGDDVKITVLGVKGNQVRVGIKAPESVSVNREEIYRRIQEESKPIKRTYLDTTDSLKAADNRPTIIVKKSRKTGTETK